ncbi:DUF4366 domain-containing protein [Candidatus Parcubacteria bacterium]|nr:DUF4366 domain-containing protein [Candidatus Parcubacteria bacterium]
MMNRKTLISILVVLLVVAGAFYYFKIYKLKTPQTGDAVEMVSKLIMLPEGEKPTVATISDPALLQGQPFFANAQKGDELLIYSVAQKAYLYRPSINKLIEVSVINTNASPQGQ